MEISKKQPSAGAKPAPSVGITNTLPDSPVVPPANGATTASARNVSTSPAVPGKQAPLDLFDPANLRLTQQFQNLGGVKKHVTTVPVRKPTKEEFVRVHPDPDFTLDTLLIELKESREMYLLAPPLWAELSTERTVSARRLHTVINRQGVMFLWPLRLPSADGRQDKWSESALEAAETAKTKWIRLQSDMSLGAYVFFTPQGEVSEPEWPGMTLHEALRLAFRTAIIDTLDHVVLRRLRGEVA